MRRQCIEKDKLKQIRAFFPSWYQHVTMEQVHHQYNSILHTLHYIPVNNEASHTSGHSTQPRRDLLTFLENNNQLFPLKIRSFHTPSGEIYLIRTHPSQKFESNSELQLVRDRCNLQYLRKLQCSLTAQYYCEHFHSLKAEEYTVVENYSLG